MRKNAMTKKTQTEQQVAMTTEPADLDQTATPEPKAEENSQGADLAVYNGPGTMMAPADIFAQPGRGMFTTLDTTKNKAMIAAAMSDADFNLMEYFDKGNSPINMIGVMVQSVNLTDDESGEVTSTYRTVIFDDQNRTFAAVSEGVIGSLQNIFALYGFPSKENPIKVAARRKRTRKGFNVTNLVPVE
jgi:hypothetical protein